MKVATLQPTQTAAARKVRSQKQAGGGTAFVSLLGAEDASALDKPDTATPIGLTGSLLSVQTVDDAVARRAKGLRRGHAILDHLDEIRAGLLAGLIPKGQLNGLIRAIQSARSSVSDPRLAEVLDEIDLRAQVELAKLSIVLDSD